MTAELVSRQYRLKTIIKFFILTIAWIGLSGQAQSQAIELLASKLAAPPWQRVKLQHNAQSFDFAVYANHDLSETDFNINEIVIVLHGLSRNGDGYFASAQSSLNQVRPDQTNILLVAPQFVAPQDRILGFTDLPTWAPNAWASGLDAANGPIGLSSYDAIDELLLALTDKSKYPSLRKVVFAGHSAGGQLVHRYAVLNQIDSRIRKSGIDLQYVVANPSAYMYFTKDRPTSDTTFGPFNEQASCPNYDQYRYGTRDIIHFGAGLSASVLLERYLSRPVTYMMGTSDNNPAQSDLDKTCAAKAQGATRIQRARRYVAYERFVATPFTFINHDAYEVVGVGHNQSGMFQSTCGVKVLFGAEVAANKVSARCEYKPAQPVKAQPVILPAKMDGPGG